MAVKRAIRGGQPHQRELDALFGKIIAVHDDGGGDRSIVIPASTDQAACGRRLRSAKSGTSVAQVRREVVCAHERSAL
jgi:hypothetical protein